MRRMIDLAERFACHISGGGTSTTSSEIPKEWKPFISNIVRNATGAMGNLPLFGGGGGSGGPPPPGGGGGGGGLSGEKPPQLPDPARVGEGVRIRRPTGGERPVDPTGEGGPGGAPSSWWMPGGEADTWRPNQGAYAYHPAAVAGPSALENRAAAGATRVGEDTEEFGRAGESYAAGSEALSGKSLADMPALQAALGVFDESIRPSVLNTSALSGHDSGTAMNVAMAKAKASYLMPTIFKGLDVEAGDRNRLLAAGQGYAGLAGQKDVRQFGAMEAQERIGATGRGITQSRRDSEERERQRLIGASERVNLGPLASLLPAVMGSSTTTSQSKI